MFKFRSIFLLSHPRRYSCHGLLAVSCVFVATLCAMPLSAQSPTKTPIDQQQKLEELVAVICAKSSSYDQRSQAFQAMSALNNRNRIRVFKILIEKADEAFAVSAACQLVREAPYEAAPPITRQYAKWSQNGRHSVLGDIQNSLQIYRNLDDLRRLARQELQKTFPSLVPIPRSPLENPSTLTNTAALIVADTGGNAGKKALHTALQAQPYSYGLWFALAQLRDVRAQEARLAKQIYMDSEKPLMLRLAAATALAPRDAKAMQYVNSVADSFIKRFGPLSSDQLLGIAIEVRKGNLKRNEVLAEMLQQIPLRPILYLPKLQAERLALRVLKTKNPALQEFGALALAIKSPELFLKTDRRLIPSERYAYLLVYIGLRHPKFKAKAAKMISFAKFNAARQHLERDGFAPVPASGIVLGL